MELENTEFDLQKELEELVDMFSVQCSNHNVETVLDLSGTTSFFFPLIYISGYIIFWRMITNLCFLLDNIPRNVRGDPGRVFQIFSNLINNSIKFTSCKCSNHTAKFASSSVAILRADWYNSPIFDKFCGSGCVIRVSSYRKLFQMSCSGAHYYPWMVWEFGHF